MEHVVADGTEDVSVTARKLCVTCQWVQYDCSPACAVVCDHCRSPHVPLSLTLFPLKATSLTNTQPSPLQSLLPRTAPFEARVINVPFDTSSGHRGSPEGHGHTHRVSHTHTPNLLHTQAIHQTVLTGRVLLSAASRCMMVTSRLPQRDHHVS